MIWFMTFCFYTNKYYKSNYIESIYFHNFSAIDEIVLSYVLGIIECLDVHDVDETEDVEPFAEMMEAYLPGFEAISV